LAGFGFYKSGDNCNLNFSVHYTALLKKIFNNPSVSVNFAAAKAFFTQQI